MAELGTEPPSPAPLGVPQPSHSPRYNLPSTLFVLKL